jgi:hypothetical protein
MWEHKCEQGSQLAVVWFTCIDSAAARPSSCGIGEVAPGIPAAAGALWNAAGWPRLLAILGAGRALAGGARTTGGGGGGLGGGREGEVGGGVVPFNGLYL